MNEKIARWLGWEKLSRPALPMSEDEPPLEWKAPSGGARFAPYWDRYISEWHGGDGLLSKIEEKGPHDVFMRKFLGVLMANTRGARGVIAQESDGSEWVEIGTAWAILKATPAQLAAALVEVIDDA